VILVGSGDQKPSTVNQGFNGGEWLELGDRRGILFDPQICVGISTDRLRSKLLDF
jgi:hypothetical protein